MYQPNNRNYNPNYNPNYNNPPPPYIPPMVHEHDEHYEVYNGYSSRQRCIMLGIAIFFGLVIGGFIWMVTRRATVNRYPYYWSTNIPIPPPLISLSNALINKWGLQYLNTLSRTIVLVSKLQRISINLVIIFYRSSVILFSSACTRSMPSTASLP